MQSILIDHATSLGLDLNLMQADLLLKYLTMLQQWNKVHNLCAKADLVHMLGYHLLDSISVVAQIDCDHKMILDVGTGAGLPGIPLAILLNTSQITLLDARSKKVAFLHHAINNLNLTNVKIALTRVEDYTPLDRFDLIISRAFSDLPKFVGLTSRLMKNASSKLVAMRSDPAPYAVGMKVKQSIITQIKEFKVPVVTGKRSLIILSQIL